MGQMMGAREGFSFGRTNNFLYSSLSYWYLFWCLKGKMSVLLGKAMHKENFSDIQIVNWVFDLVKKRIRLSTAQYGADLRGSLRAFCRHKSVFKQI
jgi:hypothetical protein